MKNSERSFARRIDLTSLQLFVAVCELGSIGRAAEREYIAASAVSKRLSDLEAAVDTALLYRHSRGVTLTPAGESLGVIDTGGAAANCAFGEDGRSLFFTAGSRLLRVRTLTHG